MFSSLEDTDILQKYWRFCFVTTKAADTQVQYVPSM